MKKLKSVIKVGTFYFIGNVFDKAISFITVPIFTRMLTTSDYGVLNTYLSWVSIMSVIITLSLGNSVRTAVYDFKSRENKYISSIFSLSTLVALGITVAVCAVSRFFPAFLPLNLILLCCLNSFSYSIINAVQYKYMMQMNYIKRTILHSLPNFISVIFAILLISNMSENRYMGRIYANAFVLSAVALPYLIYYFTKEKCFYNKEYWKYGLSFSLPLIFHLLSTVILSQSDRTMITLFKDASETGLYSLAYQFGLVPQVVVTTFENVWIPWFSNRLEENDKDSVNKKAVPYIMIVAFLCMAVMMVAPEVLKFMSTEAYYRAVYIIPPIVAGTFLMFLASVSLDLEYYMKKTKTIALNTLLAATINIVLNLIFVPRYGGTAAAYTTAVSYFFSFAMHYIVARRIDRDLFPFRLYIIPLVLITGATFVSILIMDLPILRWIIGIIIGMCVLYVGYKFTKTTKISSKTAKGEV